MQQHDLKGPNREHKKSTWPLGDAGRQELLVFVGEKIKLRCFFKIKGSFTVGRTKQAYTEDVSLMVSGNIIYEITFFILEFSWQTNQNAEEVKQQICHMWKTGNHEIWAFLQTICQNNPKPTCVGLYFIHKYNIKLLLWLILASNINMILSLSQWEMRK